jgi:hypothetical protein
MMSEKYELKKIADKIASLKKTAEELRDLGEDIPALHRNARRILAGIKMLELNISDISE